MEPVSMETVYDQQFDCQSLDWSVDYVNAFEESEDVIEVHEDVGQAEQKTHISRAVASKELHHCHQLRLPEG